MQEVNMSISKAWDWNESNDPYWLNPSEESYYLCARWKKLGYEKLLDLGCGLGRHSILFAQHGFLVSALDLSVEGTNYLIDWAAKENLDINVQVADMLSLPYPGNFFDCLFSLYSIHHTDTNGMMKIMNEIKRVTKQNGEIYITLGSKESENFKNSGFPKIDENTVLKSNDGTEKDVPHCYFDLDEIIDILRKINLEPINIRHKDECYFNGDKRSSSKNSYSNSHYYILAKNNAIN